jgi:hypothetical protein
VTGVIVSRAAIPGAGADIVGEICLLGKREKAKGAAITNASISHERPYREAALHLLPRESRTAAAMAVQAMAAVFSRFAAIVAATLFSV